MSKAIGPMSAITRRAIQMEHAKGTDHAAIATQFGRSLKAVENAIAGKSETRGKSNSPRVYGSNSPKDEKPFATLAAIAKLNAVPVEPKPTPKPKEPWHTPPLTPAMIASGVEMLIKLIEHRPHLKLVVSTDGKMEVVHK